MLGPRLFVINFYPINSQKRSRRKQGCKLYLKFISPPPFLDLYFCPQLKFIKMRGERRRLEIVSLFFCCNFVDFKWIGEKNMHTFYELGKKSNWGKIMHFSPFFHPLSIIFFPQHVIWSYFCPPKSAKLGVICWKVY